MPRKEIKHAEGREFYDDSYDSDDYDSMSHDCIKLDFSRVSFYGRKEELQILHTIYDKVVVGNNLEEPSSSSSTPTSPSSPQNKIPVTFIRGFSGAGKSTLVKRFLNDVLLTSSSSSSLPETESEIESREKKDNYDKKNKKKCFSLCGKFNKSNCELPFSAIVEGLTEFSTSKALLTNNDILEEIREHAEIFLGHDGIDALLTFVPALTNVIIGPSSSSSSSKKYNNRRRSSNRYNNNNTRRSYKNNQSLSISNHSGDQHRRSNFGNLGTDQNNDNNPRRHSYSSGFALLDPFNNKATTFSSLNLLKRVLLTFINLISTEDHPVVIFFDDLQWADNASLDLIASLLTDSMLNHVMFIGSYRSTEVDEDSHPLYQKLINRVCHNSHSSSEEGGGVCGGPRRTGRQINHMDLLNLSVGELGEYVSDLLDLHQSEAHELIQAVYDQTRGNIFYAIQLLEEFERDNMLFFSKIFFKWEWNIKDINSKGLIQLSDSDVIDIVVKKIKSTPRKLQNVLIVIAHTRSQIDIDTLQILLKACNNHNNNISINRNKLIRLLDFAVQQGILTNFMGSMNYKFAHDRIRQAVQSLLPIGDEKDHMREQIGVALLDRWYHNNDNNITNTTTTISENSSSRVSSNGGATNNTTMKKDEWIVFVAASHLNEIHWMYNDPIRMTLLNIEAGERSLKVADFYSASEFFRAGLLALNIIDSPWKNHYDTSLRLCQALVCVELILGRYEFGEKMAKQVRHHAKDAKDALPTYRSLAQALGRQEQYGQAIDICWDALTLLGEESRKKKESIINSTFSSSSKSPKYYFSNLKNATRYFKAHSDEEILNLPIMENIVSFHDDDSEEEQDDTNDTYHYKLTAMSFYNEAAHRAFFSGNVPELTITILRRLRITVEYGICGFSALAFAHFAGIIGPKDQQLAIRIANIARKILILTKAKNLECQTLKLITLLVTGWSDKTYLTSIKTLNNATRVGMFTGDIEFAFSCWNSSIYIKFMAGELLGTLLSECTNFIEQVQLFNFGTFVHIKEQMRLQLLYLTGNYSHNNNNSSKKKLAANDERGNNDGDKNGVVINWEKLNEEEPGSTDIYACIYHYHSRLALAVYFGEYDYVQRWIDLLKNVSRLDTSFEGSIMGVYYSGLALSGLARCYSVRRRRHHRLHHKISGGSSSTVKKYLTMAKAKVTEMKKLLKSRETTTTTTATTKKEEEEEEQSKNAKSYHRYKIMEADLLSSQKDTKLSLVATTFADAIRVSVESNHNHDAALCNELAGEYFLEKGEKDLARVHFFQAQILYEEWGAIGKVHHVQQKMASYFDHPKNSSDHHNNHTNNNNNAKKTSSSVDDCSCDNDNNDDYQSKFAFDEESSIEFQKHEGTQPALAISLKLPKKGPPEKERSYSKVNSAA